MDSAYDMTGASDDPEEEGVLKDVECRDLSAWRISIPRLEPRNDSITGKACFVFIIQVESSPPLPSPHSLHLYKLLTGSEN